ncbi:MAG: hypothetical protein WBF48_12875 [Halarcobacter sp.]
MRNPEIFLKAFKVSRKYKMYAWLLAILIITIGIYLSIIKDDWVILARAGALIVILSLSLESTGIIQKLINRIISTTKELTREIVLMQVKRNTNLYGNSDNRTEDDINKISEKELNRRIERTQLLIEKTMYRDLRKTEFSIATLGTLLWGFADLIGCYI